MAFYLSVIGFFLFLTVQSLEKRRYTLMLDDAIPAFADVERVEFSGARRTTR